MYGGLEKNGVVARRAPRVSRLLFAHGTLLFFRAAEEEAIRVKQVIDMYANGTDQLIN
jgi:hypothetical protein